MLTIISLVFGNFRLFALGGLALGAVTFLAYEHHKIYSEGEAAAVQNIQKANDANMAKAAAAQTSVDACYRGGFVWNLDTGKCVTPAK